MSLLVIRLHTGEVRLNLCGYGGFMESKVHLWKFFQILSGQLAVESDLMQEHRHPEMGLPDHIEKIGCATVIPSSYLWPDVYMKSAA